MGLRISMEIRYGLITSAFEAWIEHVVTGRPIVEIPTPEAPSPVRPLDTVFQPTQTARQDQARMIRPTDATLPWTTEVYGLLASIGGISVASRFLTVNTCTITRHRQAVLDVWAEGGLAADRDQ